MSQYEVKYRDVLKKCSDRYALMLKCYIDDCSYWGYASRSQEDDVDRLLKFIREFDSNVDSLPLMKLNRWLGYIQGTIIQLKLTTVEKERDWTRPLFRPLDFGDE